MIFSRTCTWCGESATAYWPPRLHEFTQTHERECGASASLHWLDDARVADVEDLHLDRLALEVPALDLRESAAHVA